ncbi:hypothetical protein LOTGIDRAFT_169527 [Lottia gigantea]|uniref:C-type lectin domain-containing protein n=1 Tax=Lottia gigantea TaxID=225164 RepID=V3YYS5_LOTGI|nr:hypothetical protein LOTGIDRAFT_169527 [Lottia gigantea]ESO83303.1 hypothetical protein LOTGIDRAFT_169527 [Lottia gigantea]
MDHVNGKSYYGAILLFSLIGASLNSVIKPRELTLGNENRNWMNAEKACQEDGLQLLSSITKDNMVDIRTLMNLWNDDDILKSSVWVGLTRHKGELGFKWDSCSDVIPNDELPWSLAFPLSSPVERCVIIDKHNFKLKTASCFNQYQYICERPRDKCWFDIHLLRETTEAKLHEGTFSRKDCEDQCRNFRLGNQECVLIEIKGGECYIVKSDKQYIDDTPHFKSATSAYTFVEVKRCLARSNRHSTMDHTAYYSLPPREPCPSSSSTSVTSSDLPYSSPVSESVSASLMDVASYTETSSEYNPVIYLSSTEINVLSSTEISVFLTDDFYQTELKTSTHFSDLNTESELTVTSKIHFGSIDTGIELIIQASDFITLSCDTTINDYSTDPIETSLLTSEDAHGTWSTSDTDSRSSIMILSSLSPSMPFSAPSTDMDMETVLPSVTSSTPYQPIYSVTNPKFNSLCRCVCLNNDSSTTGFTQTKLAEIRKKLFVDTSTLSSTRRKLTSAEDHRPSAIITGQLGLVVLILVFCFFLILDAQRFIVAIYEFMKRKSTKTVVPS